MDPADVVLRFLESLGRKSEAEFYLALFRAEAKEKFAAIYVDANVARHATDAVVLELRFLAALGLSPIVVLGLFEPTDAPEHASRIRRRLEKSGVPAEVLHPAAEHVAATARAGVIPIVPFPVGDGDRFASLGGLLASLGTRKLIFLHRPGGLRRGGELIPLVNLTTDYDALVASKDLSRKQRAMLQQSRRLVHELVPHKLVIAITSPLDLLRELFTMKGAGTMLRRGAVIEKLGGFADIDVARLRDLLASAFGRPPRDAFFARAVSRIYLEQSYRGAAVVVSTPLGAYLSKFAVDREAQGEGMGRDLWEALADDHAVIYWRARATNPIGAWYAKLCDGLMRFPDWHVFWRGLAPADVPAAVAFALAQPVDIPQGTE